MLIFHVWGVHGDGLIEICMGTNFQKHIKQFHQTWKTQALAHTYGKPTK
jgi:hypothetical protein